MRNSYWESIFLMYYIILNNFYFGHFLIWTLFAYQNRHWKIALALIESKKKFQLFVFFIVSLAAPWRADSKNVYMTSFRIRCIGQSDCCQKRCLTQALNWCLTLETIVSCRIWQILNPRKCHITNSHIWWKSHFWPVKNFCDSGRNMKWRRPQINDFCNKLYLLAENQFYEF